MFRRAWNKNSAPVSDDYVCLESLRTDEGKWNPDLRTATLEQPAEELYDDVEGIERDL